MHFIKHCPYCNAPLKGYGPSDCGHVTTFTIPSGWYVRDDGNIETADGVVPLEEFAAAGRIDSVQLDMAREIKKKHDARQAK